MCYLVLCVCRFSVLLVTLTAKLSDYQLKGQTNQCKVLLLYLEHNSGFQSDLVYLVCVALANCFALNGTSVQGGFCDTDSVNVSSLCHYQFSCCVDGIVRRGFI